MRHEILAEGCEVWCGDMLEVLPTLGEFDACVTDPPYGLGKKMQGGTWAVKNSQYTDMHEWDAEIKQEWIDAILAHSGLSIIWGGHYFSMPPARCVLSWCKPPFPTMADFELAWTNLDKPAKRFQSARVPDGPKEHPTQKPVSLIEWCIDQLPADVGTILDPFMGSGTTGVAAVKKGKAFYGIEREPKYFEIAIRRIEDALRRPDLFIPQPSPKPTQGSLLP